MRSLFDTKPVLQLTLEQLDANTKKLEDNLIELLLTERENLSNDNSTDLSLEFMIAKSFPDTINKKINSNIPKIAGSFLIMFVYVCLSLGKLNCVENRVSYKNSMHGLMAISSMASCEFIRAVRSLNLQWKLKMLVHF